MSRALETLGRFAARRPWLVIGSWLIVGVLVVTSAAAFGRELDDPFEAPGLDSHSATELLAKAGSTEEGLGADVVLTPQDAGATLLDSPAAQAEVTRIQDAIEGLPTVVATTGVVSPDGRVQLIRVQYPEREELGPQDLTDSRPSSTTSARRRHCGSRPAATCTSRSSSLRPASARRWACWPRS